MKTARPNHQPNRQLVKSLYSQHFTPKASFANFNKHNQYLLENTSKRLRKSSQLMLSPHNQFFYE